MLSIIFSVNKIINHSNDSKKDDNKNIFSNVFKFMGKRQKFNVILD